METKKWAIAVHGGVGSTLTKPEKIKKMKTALKEACRIGGNLLRSVKN